MRALFTLLLALSLNACVVVKIKDSKFDKHKNPKQEALVTKATLFGYTVADIFSNSWPKRVRHGKAL